MDKKDRKQAKSDELNNINLKEPQATYSSQIEKIIYDKADYISLENFRVEAKTRARKILREYGINH